jgi:hypothetical protein
VNSGVVLLSLPRNSRTSSLPLADVVASASGTTAAITLKNLIIDYPAGEFPASAANNISDRG